MPDHPQVLVATLGGQPQIVTLTLDLLLRRGFPISEVIVLHPAAHASLRLQQALLRLHAEFTGGRYPLAPHPIHFHTLIGVQPLYVYQQALEAALRPTASPTALQHRSAEARTHSVTVFSTPTCPWCSRLKAYLRKQQIAFKEIDVSRDAQAAKEMVRRSGQMGVPQAWIDGQVVVGFDRKRIDTLLGLSAA